MILILCIAVALLGTTLAEAVTPVAKVIKLLEGLTAEVAEEGRQENAAYNAFACFCKTTTTQRSESIIAEKDQIFLLSAEIEHKTATANSKEMELRHLLDKEQKTTAELAAVEAQCKEDEEKYVANAADLKKANSSLAYAIEALEASKPTMLLALKHFGAVTDRLRLASGKQQAITAFLQVDPEDPNYKFHSHGILKTLQDLLAEFMAKKQALDEEWSATSTACRTKTRSLQDILEKNKQDISTLGGEVETLKADIASAREELVLAAAVLKDEQLYVTDLTERCGQRAKDWDQRTKLRKDELEALQGALMILKNNVTDLDTAVNKRVLLQKHGHNASIAALAATGTPQHAKGAEKQANTTEPMSFLQGVSAQVRSHSSFLARTQAGASAQAQREAATLLLHDEARRIGSTALSVLAAKLADDPFIEVKKLIQKLIERLLAEATTEATKKGWCDTELGKATETRAARLEDVKTLDVELAALEVKRDQLAEDIEQLTDSLAQLRSNLATATDDRKEEKTTNLAIIKDAKEGLNAIAQAINVLKVFYKRAAKETVLLQASPVDEDTQGAGFAGAYVGKQEASKGIIGMLEVIKTDFERTIRMTEAAEVKAHADFVELERASKADISGKEQKKELNEEDLATTKTTIEAKMEDLQTNMNLLDAALKIIDSIKPTCIDTHMSYSERVEKRDEEIAALKQALCILAPEDPDTKSQLCAGTR